MAIPEDPVTPAHVSALIAADVVFYQHASEARRLSELIDRRERIPADRDVCRERQYIRVNLDSRREHAKMAEAAYAARQLLISGFPVLRARLAGGVRFIAGLEDVWEGGGIDFEETMAPAQELRGFVLRTHGDTRWLVCESRAVTRGTQLLAGGVRSIAHAGCPDDYNPPKAQAPGSRAGLDFSVSSGNSLALVGIKLDGADEVRAV